MGPIDGIPYEYPTPSELALAHADQTGVEPGSLPPSPPLPAELAGPDSTDPVASPGPDPSSPSTADASVQSVITVEENLDDPDHFEWEYQGMDFGPEPTDQRWDVWGCDHKCRRFHQEDVHEKWLKIEHLECQNCFERVRPHAQSGAAGDETHVTEKLAFTCKKCSVIFCGACRHDVRARREAVRDYSS